MSNLYTSLLELDFLGQVNYTFMGDIREDADYDVDSYREEIEDWLLGTYHQMMDELNEEGLPVFTKFQTELSNTHEDV